MLSIVLKGDGAQGPQEELDEAKPEGNHSSNVNAGGDKDGQSNQVQAA